MMKIAVVGATGPTGIHLVTELRKAVASVRCDCLTTHMANIDIALLRRYRC